MEAAYDADPELQHETQVDWRDLQEHLAQERKWFISDDDRFFRKFKEYLAPCGRREAATDECVLAITDFSRYQKARNASFSLARLRSLYRVSREDLLPLPPPWDWLDRFREKKTRDKAHAAYNDLLDFLEDLLVVNGRWHMSRVEIEFRQGQLKEIEAEVLAHHPYKTWARDLCRPATCNRGVTHR